MLVFLYEYMRKSLMLLAVSSFLTILAINIGFCYLDSTSITLNHNQSMNLTLKVSQLYKIVLGNKVYNLTLNSIELKQPYNEIGLTFGDINNLLLTRGPTVSLGIPVNSTHEHLVSFKLIKLISKTQAEISLHFEIREIPPEKLYACGSQDELADTDANWQDPNLTSKPMNTTRIGKLEKFTEELSQAFAETFLTENKTKNIAAKSEPTGLRVEENIFKNNNNTQTLTNERMNKKNTNSETCFGAVWVLLTITVFVITLTFLLKPGEK